MAMKLNDFLAEHPVNRERVEAHKEQVLADVLGAITQDLRGTESLADVIEDVAYWEAVARKRFTGSSEDTFAPIDPTMTSPVEIVAAPIPDMLMRMLRESMRPGETLDGLVTALLIAEVRHRRTDMHWPVFNANEPVMTDDATTIAFLIRHHDTTITTTAGGQLMYTITADVRPDVLEAFDRRRPSGAACSTLQGGGEHRLGRATL